MTKAILWALSQDALELLDAFAQDQLSGACRQQDLSTVEKSPHGIRS